jgi:hypothetical protein
LQSLKAITFKAFEFNTNGIVIAIVSAAIRGGAGVPSTVMAADKLPNLARAFDEKV